VSIQAQRTGWGAFGAYSLNGELPADKVLSLIESRLRELTDVQERTGCDKSREIAAWKSAWTHVTQTLFPQLEPWETVLVARHPQRPLATDYIRLVVSDFCELHGDQRFGDDRAIITGFGEIGPHRVLIIGQNRGRQIPERVAANFGCPHPEGYRKALAKMKLAAKFGLPIVSLIDTPGAYPGVEAERRGMAAAIADNLMAMPRLPVPLVAVVIGEGGSGGALGIGVADRLAMFEHSVFSVISPEGCAAILWNTSEQAKAAASALRMRANDLLELGMIDEIIPEPAGAAHRDPAQAAASLERFVTDTLAELSQIPIPLLLEQRYQRLRTMGASFERTPASCAAELTAAEPGAADDRPPVRRAAG
jgi:acetyl-CoA carboxylase carboxyl transferase subunit alpha